MGHVGRNKYLPMLLPIQANDIQEAVMRARNHGGVKRDHKDWCLDKPIEVDQETYRSQEMLTYNDLYWQNKTKRYLKDIEDRLINEPNYHRQGDINSNRIEFKKKRDKSSIMYRLKKMAILMESRKVIKAKGVLKTA